MTTDAKPTARKLRPGQSWDDFEREQRTWKMPKLSTPESRDERYYEGSGAVPFSGAGRTCRKCGRPVLGHGRGLLGGRLCELRFVVESFVPDLETGELVMASRKVVDDPEEIAKSFPRTAANNARWVLASRVKPGGDLYVS